jgi:transposase-like protein
VADLLDSSTAESKQQRMRTTESDQNGHGVMSIESTQLKQLQEENAELNRVNGILKAAAALFAAEMRRPNVAVEDLVRGLTPAG